MKTNNDEHEHANIIGQFDDIEYFEVPMSLWQFDLLFCVLRRHLPFAGGN